VKSSSAHLRLLSLAGVAALSLASVGSAYADKVGVAAAVNPDAFSSLSGSPKTQLNIGKSIFFSERINTTGSGLVQVLLVDGSTFTVGPGSDLVIDKFVYDPNKKSGEMVATFSKGVMRFVGGKLSKNEGGVTINTSAGALAIRGGMAMMLVNGPKSATFSFLFGVNMTLAGRLTVFQPGNSIYVTSDGATIGPTTQAAIDAMMAALTKGGGGGNDGNNGGKPTQLVNTLSLQDLIADATQDKINNTLQGEENNDAANDPAPSDDTHPSNDPQPITTANNTPPSQISGGPTDTPGGPTDTTDNTPPTDTTDNTPPIDTTDNTPPTDTTDNTPPTDTTDNTPPTDTTDNTPPTDTTDNTPPCTGASCDDQTGDDQTGDDDKPLPSATGGTQGGYAAGMRAGHGHDAPTAVKGVTYVPAEKTLSFKIGDNGDVTINFADNGKASQNSISVTGASVVNGSHASITPRQDLLCTNCDFLKWGTWDAQINYKYGTDNNETKLAASGWWIGADEVTSAQDLEVLAANNATATYSGNAWGTVANNTGTGGWKTYDASGKLAMDWSFASRSGNLEISKFDTKNFDGGLSFSGPMCAPGVACGSQQLVTAAGSHFGGPISGNLPGNLGSLSGSAAGSFVNNGQIAAGGIMGNWNVAGDSYRATGIFGGMGTPHR
jgi:hypothetical protein